MNALRVARHSLELGDVAALNTTHHFNYLFGHKTVEAGGGGCLAAWLAGRFGLLNFRHSFRRCFACAANR